MSFDWKSFATGFLEQTQKTIEERSEEAKTFEKEQRTAAERNAQTISRRRAIADQITGYANYLQSNGVSDEQLQAVIASGPTAITSLTERVQAAVTANRGRPLGASDVSALITMPEGFSPLDMTTQEFIDQTYGLRVAPREEAPAEELTFLQRIMGRGEMSRAEERLSRTPFAEGMTILDINRAAQQGDYRSLVPGTFVSIVGAGSTYDFDASTDFTTTFERRLAVLQDSNRWTETLGLPLAQREAAQAALLEQAMGPIIRMGINTYGDALIADQDSYLRSIMGDDYMDSLIERETSPDTGTTTTTETSSPAVTGAPAPTPTAETGSDQSTTVVSPTTEEPPAVVEPTVELVDPTVIPAVPPSERVTLSVGDAAMPAPPMNATVRIARNEEDEGEVFTYQQWLDMSRRERRTAGLPINLNRANAFFTEYGVDPTTGAPFDVVEPAPETQVETDSGETVTYQQWLEMSRTQRKDAGLPESFIGGQMYFNRFGVGLGINDPETGQSIFTQTPESRDAQQSEAYRALSAQGVDDISINLLETRGRDMARYLRAQGVTDPEAAFNALTEWGQQNNIVMPFDKSALIFALMQDINR